MPPGRIRHFTRVPLLARPAVSFRCFLALNTLGKTSSCKGHAVEHCWASQQWHPPIAMLLAIVTVFIAGCGGDPVATTVPKSSRGVEVDKGRLTIDGKELQIPCPSANLFAVIGSPARHEMYVAEAKQPPARVHIWDETGLYAVESPETGQVIQLAIVLDRRAKTFTASDLDRIWPKKDFAGGVKLDGAEIVRTSTPKRINGDLLVGQLLPEQKFPYVWTMPSGRLLARVVTQNEGTSVLEVTLGR